MNNPITQNTPQPEGKFRNAVSNCSGNIMVYMVVVIVIFGVLGVSLVSLFSTSTQSGATSNDARRARYIAESGIRYALGEIRNAVNFISTAEKLNQTAKFNLGKDGSFTVDVFSPGLASQADTTLFGGGPIDLDVPYSGELPDDFTIPASNVSAVHWGNFKGAPPPDDSYAGITGYTISDPPESIRLILNSDFDAAEGDTICFALQVTDADTRIEQGDSIFVAEEAADLFPAEKGAVRLLANGIQYNIVYAKREKPVSGKVELTNLQAMPGGASWTDILNVQTTDYVILSPYNFRVSASGTSNDVKIDIGINRPFWALAAPSGYTITMPELLDDNQVNETDDVIEPRAGGEEKIEMGRRSTPAGGMGDLWYSGDRSIGGDQNFCADGRCLFGDGVRVYFTADFTSGSPGGEGFTFALIAGGSLSVPVNTINSAGGDFQLPELLAYAGASLKDDATFLDGSGEGIKPPKIALEFDTRTNLNTPLDYCTANNLNLIPGSRNDPEPGGEQRDVLQYVFWGSDDATDLDLSCRSVAKESYDDNRHDAEGKEASLNFAFDTGANVRSVPTFDLASRLVYFGTDDTFWAVDTEDGTEEWRYTGHSGVILGKAELDTIGVDRFVYFSATDNSIYRLRADTGALDLEIIVPASIGDSTERVGPAVNNNNHNVYIGSNSSERFYAYNSNGAELWRRDLGEDIENTATIDKTGGTNDGNVYVGTADDNNEPVGRLFAFDPVAIPPVPPPQFFQADNDVTSQPALNADGTAVYIVTDNGTVVAIDATTGSTPAPELWTRNVSGVNWLDPAVWVKGSDADGTVYVATDNGHLHAFNPANGNDRPGWASGLDLGNSINLSSPAVGPDGTVYIGTDGSSVLAFNPDATLKWEYPTGDLVQSTPEIGEDGVVYVGSNDNKLYAIATTAVPRSYRNNWANGQRGYLTSGDLFSTQIVDDTNDWLDGSVTQRGPWAIRMEVIRDPTPVNIDGDDWYTYTLRTWIRQCAESTCADINGTAFQDTTRNWDPTFPGWETNLPFEQQIKLIDTDDAKFERFLFGFTTAAGPSDTQLIEIRDFQLTFRRPSEDDTITDDPAWPPP